MRMKRSAGLLAVLALTVSGAWAGSSPTGADPPGAAAPLPVAPQATLRRPGKLPPGDPRSSGACAAWERIIPINPAVSPLHIGLKTYPQTLKLHDREVVLTFDDGPSPYGTPEVLAALKDACAHATFFLIGRHTKIHPELARQEMAEGHMVGHHSFTHPTFTMRGFDEPSAERDIANGVAADEAAIYDTRAQPPDHPHVPFFRFPGFADTEPLRAFLDARHYAIFGTDMWAMDWVRMTPDHERRRVLSLLERAPHHNGVILFHDNIRSTAEMLPDLLRDLREQHYTIGRLVYDPTAPPPALTPPVKGWRAETEAIIAHLKRPIEPGAHRLDDPTLEMNGDGDDDAATAPPL